MAWVSAHSVAKCCAAACSVGLLLAGVTLLTTASQEIHEHKAAGFREAVEAWPHHKSHFNNLHVSSMFNGSRFTSWRHMPLKTSSFDDSKSFLEARDLPPYEPLTYRLESVPNGFMPQVKLHTVEWNGPFNEAVGGSQMGLSAFFMRLHLQISSDVLTTEDIPLLQAKPHTQAKIYHNQCGALHGVYMDNLCWNYQVLQSICLQVTYLNSRWQFAPRFSGDNSSYGCAYVGRNWTAARYKDFERIALADVANDHVNFHDLEVVIRSEHDPFLKALELTDGTLDFGMTAKDERWLGFFLIGLAIMMSCPAAVALCLYWRSQAKKRRHARRPRVTRVVREAETVGMKYAVGPDDDEVYDVR